MFLMPKEQKEQTSEWAYFIHYLRNSIGTLGALSDYYGNHPPDAKQVKRLLDQLKRVSVQSQDYINAFSEFTQPLNPAPQAVSMPDWLRERTARHRVAHTPGIKFKTTLPDAPFIVQADPDLLARAVDALLENAAEAMPKGGELTVSLALEDGNVVFRFRNTGSHVAPSLLSDLGKPFLTMKPGRLGLGLGWARRVAEAHNGDFGGSNVLGGVEFWMHIPSGGTL
jgi:signal transduction histidine kinase